MMFEAYCRAPMDAVTLATLRLNGHVPGVRRHGGVEKRSGRGEFFALRVALQAPRHKGQVEFAAPARSEAFSQSLP
jgi:hypothetical protein